MSTQQKQIQTNSSFVADTLKARILEVVQNHIEHNDNEPIPSGQLRELVSHSIPDLPFSNIQWMEATQNLERGGQLAKMENKAGSGYSYALGTNRVRA
jgi:hypothetical protein